jgi:hypothetical protein
MAVAVKVPMAILSPYINEWLAKPNHTLTELEVLSGVPARRIFCIRRGFDRTFVKGKWRMYTHVTFDTADKLLSAMDMVDRWYSELGEFYNRVA